MRSRLLNLATLASIIFAITWAVIFPLVTSGFLIDLDPFLNAASGVDMSRYYYAPWGLHIFQPLVALPYDAAHIAVGLLNVFGLWFACRTFGGSVPVVMTSFPLLFSIFYAQPDGLWGIGLALLLIGVKRRSIPLAVFGWTIALAKFYIGVPLGIGILWCFSDFKLARRIIEFTILTMVASLFVYGPWPFEVLERLSQTPPFDALTMDLWQFVGPAVLLVWVPIVLFRNRSYSGFVAAWVMSLPYIYPHGMTHLMVTLGPVGLVADLGYIIGNGTQSVLLQTLPIIVYLMAFPPWELRRMLTGKSTKNDTNENSLEITQTVTSPV